MPRIPLPERRARLVNAAISVIGEKGVAAATTRAIAAAADMPLASFHYAFESHNALMAEAMVRILTEDAAAMESFVEPGRHTIAEGLLHALNGFVDSLVADERRQRAVLELTHYALRTPGLERLAVEQQDVARQTIAGMFDKFARESGFSWNVPSTTLADQLLVLTDGISMGYLVDHDADAIRAYLPAVADSFTRYAEQA